MTTAQITGGSVEYSRPSNYQTDKPGAKVSLTFACEDGCPDEKARAMLDYVASVAMAKALEMQSGKVDPTPQAAPVSQATSPTTLQASTRVSGIQSHSPTGLTAMIPVSPSEKKEPIIIGAAKPNDNTLIGHDDKVILDPPQIGGETPIVQPGTIVAPAATSLATPASVSETTVAAPEPITDQQLIELVTKRNGVLRAKATSDAGLQQVEVTLKRLILSYTKSVPPTVIGIPQADRQEFVDKLLAL